MPDHRWWHDGRGYSHAFCLFCGADYLTITDDPHLTTAACPSPLAEGGEEKAQEILKSARRRALRRSEATS